MSISRHFAILVSIVLTLTLSLLTWRIRWAPNNAIRWQMGFNSAFNPLHAELNPICHLLALLGAHLILHVSRLKVKVLMTKNRCSKWRPSACWEASHLLNKFRNSRRSTSWEMFENEALIFGYLTNFALRGPPPTDTSVSSCSLPQTFTPCYEVCLLIIIDLLATSIYGHFR